MIDTILETVRLLKSRGVAVLLVEQKVEAALHVVDRVAFLEHGTIPATTTPEALHADSAPLQRYIGVGLQGAI
jgi:branched-chain amino acid transport system ATP-binding protein